MMSSKIKLAVLLVTSFAIIGVFVWWLNNPNVKKYNDSKVSFAYQVDYKEQSRPAPSTNESHLLLRLQRDNPAGLIELAREDGAIIGANVTKTDFLTFLERTAEKSFPVRYTDYKKVSSNRIKVSGRDATLITYTIQGADKKTQLHGSFFIMTSGNDGYYLNIQSADERTLKADTDLTQKTLTIN